MGARISLAAGFVSVAIGALAGTALGLVAGYFEGWWDRTIMRLCDVLFAFPGILLAIGIVAILGSGMTNVIFAVAIFSIPTFARLVRGTTLALKHLTFVEAARSLGASDSTIIWRHIFPGTVSAVVVYFSLRIGTSIITAASLSFLGMGAQPPTPEWGAMLDAARSEMLTAPHAAIFPALAIFFTVLAFNLLGDGLRDALDPKLGEALGIDAPPRGGVISPHRCRRGDPVIARRQFLARGVGLAAMPLVVGCHPADRVWRVGYLLPTNPGDIGYASFVEGLAQRGYVVGKNVEMVPRFANREIGRLDALAAELVAAKVDLIVAGAPVSIRAAQKATTTIPIVMAFSGDDPVKAGFVQSLGRPGGNVTGVTALSRDLVSKWLELLFEVAPGMTRVAVLMNPSRLEHAEAIKVARAALPAGVQLQVVEGRSPEQYPAAFAEMTREGAGGLMIVADACSPTMFR